MNNLKLSVLFHVMIRDGTDISKHRYYPFDIAVRYYIEAIFFFGSDRKAYTMSDMARKSAVSSHDVFDVILMPFS